MSSLPRRIAAGLAGLLVAGALHIATAAPAEASTPWRYAQWNITGNVLNHGNLTSAYHLMDYVEQQYFSGQGPMGVSLQEVCGDGSGLSQVDFLISELGGLGYALAYQFLKSPTDYAACTSFGNAVMAWGTGPMVWADSFWFHPFNPPAPGEQRGIVCIWMSRVGGDHNACSSHSENERPHPATGHFIEGTQISYAFETNAPGAGHYWGADLNLCYRPVRSHPQTPYWILLEANGLPSLPPMPPAGECDANGSAQPQYTHPVGNLSRKYDYSFGSGFKYSSSSFFRQPSPGASVSDHHLIRGTFIGP